MQLLKSSMVLLAVPMNCDHVNNISNKLMAMFSSTVTLTVLSILSISKSFGYIHQTLERQRTSEVDREFKGTKQLLFPL